MQVIMKKTILFINPVISSSSEIVQLLCNDQARYTVSPSTHTHEFSSNLAAWLLHPVQLENATTQLFLYSCAPPSRRPRYARGAGN